MIRTRNKYKAIKVKVNGITCDSKIEARYYSDLILLEKSKLIKDLKIHPRYPIYINDKKVCAVVLDFEYHDNRDNQKHYIDVKGFYTSESKLRHKIFEAYYNRKVEIWK